MFEQLSRTISQVATRPGCKILLGYSGGVDSEVLASLLAQFAQQHPEFDYLLVYVHHGLSCNADDWAEHCRCSATRYGLPFSLQRVTVAKGARLSIEAEARRARYRAIAALMSPGDLLLTAHHQDDQLETLLLALKRGQGPRGLSAMGRIQAFDGDKLQLRPLLDVSRADIEAYAAARGMAHVEDESNADISYDRNFLRHRIIPLLKSRWPQLGHTAGRSAALCAQQQMALDEVVAEKLAAVVCHGAWGVSLPLVALAQNQPHWQNLLLRAFIEQQGLPLPSQLQLDEALKQLLQAKVDAKVALRAGELLLRRYDGSVYASSATSHNAPNNTLQAMQEHQARRILYPLTSENEGMSSQIVALPTHFNCGECRVDLTLTSTGARVRQPQTGEVWQWGTMADFAINGSYRCHPHTRHQGRELKKCWQEFAVPTWLRPQLPLLCIDGRLAAVPGVWVEQAFMADGDESGIAFALNLQQ